MGPCTFLEFHDSFWHSSSCQQRKEWSRIKYLGYPGQTLFHLKAWLRARLALKFSFPGPFFLMGAPGALHYQKPGGVCQEVTLWGQPPESMILWGQPLERVTLWGQPLENTPSTFSPSLPVTALPGGHQTPQRQPCHGEAAAPGCTDWFCFSHHWLCRGRRNWDQSHI